MKNRILAALAVASLLLTSQSGLTQEKSAAATELKELVTKIQAKAREGKKTEKDLADERGENGRRSANPSYEGHGLRSASE